jgi:hypothetical protein
MSGYLEYQAASARNQSLQHYAEAQRIARRAARARRAQLLPDALVKRPRPV